MIGPVFILAKHASIRILVYNILLENENSHWISFTSCIGVRIIITGTTLQRTASSAWME